MRFPIQVCLVVVNLGLAAGCSHVDRGSGAEPLRTTASLPRTAAETSGYRATTPSEEVREFVNQVARQCPHLRAWEFGSTFEGRPMVAAVVGRPLPEQPLLGGRDDRLVVLILANIHAGEVCGKEAMLVMLRELAQQPDHAWLDHLVLVIVPNYNADANDRIDPANRPGQVGPAEGMGERANAQGFDLNRDYMKLDSPEARALVRLMTDWQPHCFLDLHTTDGSWHRYQLTYDVPHHPAAHPGLMGFLREQMMPEMTRRMAARSFNTFYYGNFQENHTRWQTADYKPRFGLDYAGLRGCLSILSEAYAYIPYRDRVMVTHAFVTECLDYLAEHRQPVAELIREVQERTVRAGAAGQGNVPLQARPAPFPEKVLVQGYDPPSRPPLTPEEFAADTAPAPPGVPKDYEVDYYGRFPATQTVRRPYGYLIPAGQGLVLDQLRRHGITLEPLPQDTEVKVEVYRWKQYERREQAYQQHHLVTAQVTARRETRRVPAGTWLARTGQPLGTLLACLLEPESDDGLVTWNFFDDQAEVGRDYPVLRLAEVPAGW